MKDFFIGCIETTASQFFLRVTNITAIFLNRYGSNVSIAVCKLLITASIDHLPFLKAVLPAKWNFPTTLYSPLSIVGKGNFRNSEAVKHRYRENIYRE